jgi:hypothetical protein
LGSRLARDFTRVNGPKPSAEAIKCGEFTRPRTP